MNYFIAEIIGTFLLILLGNGVVANVVLNQTKGQGSGWIVITTGWGLAVYVAVVVAGPYSGAHINPAVTISLAVAGLFEWALVGPYILAQMIGAMLAAAVVWFMHKDYYKVTPDKDLKLATFCTAPAIRNYPMNVFAELVGTFVLLFAILFFTSPEIELEANQAVQFGLGSLGALPVAFLVWGIGLSLGGTTGYAINPARDLGPRIMHAILPVNDKRDSDWNYSWVPVVGPVIGGVIAAALYLLLA
ncbi:MAG: aquaporin family protein [Saprospiraceae bacterium]|nr:aquaporin family protein [Saprospiraceae bacterium]